MSELNETQDLSPKIIYDYDTHRNIPWNDVEYQPVREYLDPQKQITDRTYLTKKKGEKDNRYLTRKGFYMDYHLKVVKVLPAPGAHTFADPWDQTLNKKLGKKNKMDPKLKKYTYIQRIEIEEKNRKKPGPGTYSLNKTDQEIKKSLEKQKTKKISIGPKRFFYEDTEFMSNLMPGMGSHNPHLDVPHLKLNKTDRKFWSKKHEEQEKTHRKRSLKEPDPGSYNALPADTFYRIQSAEEEKKKKSKGSNNGFGTDAKFAYDRTSKKKIIEQRPSPFHYNMMLKWKGKGVEEKSKSWLQTRTTGFSQSVYS